MDHIETTRLVDLSQGALILKIDEIEHLRSCEECDQLLRIFIRLFRFADQVINPKERPGALKKAS